MTTTQSLEQDVKRARHNHTCREYYKRTMNERRAYNRAYMRAYYAKKKWKKYIADYSSRPEVIARARAYAALYQRTKKYKIARAKYMARPDVIAKRKKRAKIYNALPSTKARVAARLEANKNKI